MRSKEVGLRNLNDMIEKGDSESSELKPHNPNYKRVRRDLHGHSKRPELSARPKKLKTKAESRAEGVGEELSDAKQMLKKIEEMYGDLENKLKYVYDHIHLLPKELQTIVHQPEIFIEEHKKILGIFQEDLESKVVKILGKTQFEAQKKKQKKKKMKKSRRAQKLRGKKRWIPLQ